MERKFDGPKGPAKKGPPKRRPAGDKPTGERKTYSPRPSGDGERRPYSPRPSGDGERRPYSPRPSGDGERRPYSPRPSGDGERRPYSPRPSGDGERRPYSPRPSGDGERRPYSPRPSGDGERRPYSPRPSGDGERRPYSPRPSGDGERRPYSPRPSGDGERRPYSPRPSGDGERRPYSPRPSGDGERRPYSPRPSGDGERRPYSPRPSGDGERRPYSPRPSGDGERRPYSPRPSGDGERRPYSPRPSGERKTFSRDARPADSERKPFPPRRTEKRDFSPGQPTEAEQRYLDRQVDPDAVPFVPQVVPEMQIPQVLDEGAGLPDRLEGRNPILEAIKAGRTINKLWVSKKDEKPDPSLGRLIAQAREAGAVIMEVDRRVLDAMSTTHGHQGVIAQVAAHEYIELDDLIVNIKAASATPFLLILAELQESYNLGSILRIADAAGVQGVIIPMRRSVGLDAAVAKASAGAIEHVPVARVGNLSQAISTLKEAGFWIAGTDADGKTDYRQADWNGPLAILIGSEGEGLSPIMRRHCDFLISIPMYGKVNSLNAAVAAGIVTFEAAARRRGSQPTQPVRETMTEETAPEMTDVTLEE